jgi:hypothetical protein
MGYLYKKFQEAQKARHEREAIKKVVRVLVKSMDMWICLHSPCGGAPPSAEACTVLEDKRIDELMAEYRPRLAKDLGRDIVASDEELVHEKQGVLVSQLLDRKGRLFQKYSGAVKKLEEQAAEHLGNAVSELAKLVIEIRAMMPTKQQVIEEEFQELVDELRNDIEARYPGGVVSIDKFDDTLPANIPSWDIFLSRVDERKTELAAENAIAVVDQVAAMKKSAEQIIKDKINTAIRATIDEIKLDLSDDVIPFLDDIEAENLRKELMKLTEAHGVSRLV